MGVRVKDVGESESRAVMVRIRVQDLPGAKASRLPTGVSLRDSLGNLFGKESK